MEESFKSVLSWVVSVLMVVNTGYQEQCVWIVGGCSSICIAGLGLLKLRTSLLIS